MPEPPMPFPMQEVFMRRIAVCLVVLAGAPQAGCDQAGSPAAPSPAAEAPSLAVESNERIPFEGVAHSDCGTEDIAVTGVFHPVSAVTSDGRGGFHLVFHYNLEAKGTSETTGAQYIVQTRASVAQNVPATCWEWSSPEPTYSPSSARARPRTKCSRRESISRWTTTAS